LRGTSLFTATLRTREEFLPCQGLSWPGGRTIGAQRAERQMLTTANGNSCSARHELSSRAFLFIVSAECALPTHALLFVIFARIWRMPLPLMIHSALALFAQRTRIPTSARSIGFCVIWVCISSSSNLTTNQHVSVCILRGTSLFTATLRTREEFLLCQGLSWPGGRTIGAQRAERQMLTSANGNSCSARHELSSRAFLFIVSAECALPTHTLLFVIFARIWRMPLPLMIHSALALFAQRTRIPTSARSIGFCVIWVY